VLDEQTKDAPKPVPTGVERSALDPTFRASRTRPFCANENKPSPGIASEVKYSGNSAPRGCVNSVATMYPLCPPSES